MNKIKFWIALPFVGIWLLASTIKDYLMGKKPPFIGG